jgi:hypothetical protein
LFAFMPETVGLLLQVHVHGPEPEPEHELLHVPTSDACTETTEDEKFSVRLETCVGVLELYVKYIDVIDGVVGAPTPSPACTVPLKLMAAVKA